MFVLYIHSLCTHINIHLYQDLQLQSLKLNLLHYKENSFLSF
jgi:hypothetical protein